MTSIQDIPPSTEVPSQPLSSTVKWLGIVSLLTDLSSQMVYAINPIFLTKILGAPAWVVGLVEGIAESTASLMKFYSGWLSDRAGTRKPFAVAGYGLAAVSKPLTAFASIWGHVLLARFLDRIGKGLRAAPRDALIAENCNETQRGRAYGLHHAMDSLGATIGPIIGYLFLLYHPNMYRNLYILASIPGLISVCILLFAIREKRKEKPDINEKPKPKPRFSIKGLNPNYKRYLITVGIFSLGNFSDAFLLLRAQNMGVAAAYTLLLYGLYNAIDSTFTYHLGRLSDRIGRRPLVIAGYTLFAFSYLGFAVCHGVVAVWILFAIYGFYATLTLGTQKALAADMVRPDRKAMEIGAFHMLLGVAAFPASVMAGWLYSHISPSAPFYLGAVTALISAILLGIMVKPTIKAEKQN